MMTITAAPALRDRLSAAQDAEAKRQQAEAKLTALYTAAVAASDHTEAGRLKPLLDEARLELVIAEADTTALRSAMERLEREAAERSQAALEAERRKRAQEQLGQAMSDERVSLERSAAAVERMWLALQAAKDAHAEARQLETEAGRARRRQWQARVDAGDLDSMPAYIAVPNHVSVLADREPVLRELLKWRR